MSTQRCGATILNRHANLALALVLCLSAPSATALDLQADLSTHYIEIRTTFQGALLTVFGAVTEQSVEDSGAGAVPVDVVVVVRGPPEAIAVRRKEEMGPIWLNRKTFVAENAPSFYYVASTRPIDEIVDLSSLVRYRIGAKHLDIDFEVSTAAPAAVTSEPENGATFDDEISLAARSRAAVPPIPSPLAAPALPGAEESQAFEQALFRLLSARRTFTDSGQLAFVRPHLFRAEVPIPSTVPPGTYGAEVYLVRAKEVIDAEFTAFYIDKKGLEGELYELAQEKPILHGLLAVIIAAAAGWISEMIFRRR